MCNPSFRSDAISMLQPVMPCRKPAKSIPINLFLNYRNSMFTLNASVYRTMLFPAPSSNQERYERGLIPKTTHNKMPITPDRVESLSKQSIKRR